MRRVHFIGIGGIGMSALARYFLYDGWHVSGSDLTYTPLIDELDKEGAEIYCGKHAALHVRRDISLVIYNQAIDDKNSELQQARKLKIPRKSYPEVIGELTRNYNTIAIAGAHGKSTTTALVSLILEKAELDPTVIIGTKLKEFAPPPDGKNFRKGGGKWLILEADEWKASFLRYSPTIAVITNIDREHLDFYKTFANVKKSFQKFIERISPDGLLVINEDYDYLLKNIKIPKTVLRFSFNQKIVKRIKQKLKIPGAHNVLNALAAYQVAKYLEISDKHIFDVFRTYNGAWRRMEYKGEFKIQNSKCKIKVYDDYAHHPTEIKATLTAFRQKWPKNPLICVFQAHQALRLKLLFNAFKNAFKATDRVIILPTYEVAGREKQETRKQKIENRILSEKLAKKIGAIYLNNPLELKNMLTKLLLSNFYFLDPIIVVMGAGDIIKYTDALLEKDKKYAASDAAMF